MAGLLNLFEAFKTGKEIADPTKWKNIANLTRMITVVLAAGVTLYRVFIGELLITDEQLIAISGSIATLVMVGSNILAVITTKKDVSLTGVTKNTSIPNDTK